MTAPPVQGIASCIISHGAVSISRGEAARNEVDEHGPDGAEPRHAMGTKAFVLQAGYKEQVTNFNHGKE